jgi:predicted DNA-binding antitoxin AbrB/MazE fold protein
MTIHIDAVYEQGVFRPARPVTLQEGTQVSLAIEAPSQLVNPQSLVAALNEIATMSSEGSADGFSGADHDAILYGPQGAR